MRKLIPFYLCGPIVHRARHRRGPNPVMLQTTWQAQAHRARTPLRLTCFAAALAGHRDPIHANVSRMDDDRPFGPKKPENRTHRLPSAIKTLTKLWRTQKSENECEHEWEEKCPNDDCRCERD